MSNVTSICGVPRAAGGMPSRMKRPISRLSAAISRSPWSTRISTWGWLSDAVEKVWLRQGRSERATDGLHSIISTPELRGDHIYGVDSYGELRGSGALRRIDDDWKILQYNLAFTVPNDAAKDVVERIGKPK